MLKKIACSLILNIALMIPHILSAQLPGQAPSTINKPNPNPFPKTPQKPAPPMHAPKIPRRPTVSAKETLIPFALPGIVGIKDGRWVGSDNLYNLRPDISVYVELVMPEDQKFDIKEMAIKARVQEMFSKGGINPIALQEPGEPPLPLYHILIMISQSEQSLTACCACRLFEAISLKRVILEEGITFQAITWEKQDLISASIKEFPPLLDKTIDDFTTGFIERFQYFQNLKFQRQEGR